VPELEHLSVDFAPLEPPERQHCAVLDFPQKRSFHYG
jgi:hypothetical protein